VVFRSLPEPSGEGGRGFFDDELLFPMSGYLRKSSIKPSMVTMVMFSSSFQFVSEGCFP